MDKFDRKYVYLVTVKVGINIKVAALSPSRGKVDAGDMVKLQNGDIGTVICYSITERIGEQVPTAESLTKLHRITDVYEHKKLNDTPDLFDVEEEEEATDGDS